MKDGACPARSARGCPLSLSLSRCKSKYHVRLPPPFCRLRALTTSSVSASSPKSYIRATQIFVRVSVFVVFCIYTYNIYTSSLSLSLVLKSSCSISKIGKLECNSWG